ncbi:MULTISPECIES: hypothetical protein [Paenibacillus]|uniref:Uncharacterized protein n=1 Tax=Paenibacillus lignilyticus TaxID=1172615 RepID=A0ABS5CI18_9BACL|nr:MULTISPECIES: hypothetical protein [Paenibacillus]MBP3965495.1 hypothetical protein [Paenibacillus lignilyticus]SFT16855.1 hypothetical protein SAMN05428962_4909 [Paenibacillus sp. BC26]
MRSLLMTLLLIIVTVILYKGVTGGEQGTNAQLEQSGRHMSDGIRRMSP